MTKPKIVYTQIDTVRCIGVKHISFLHNSNSFEKMCDEEIYDLDGVLYSNKHSFPVSVTASTNDNTDVVIVPKDKDILLDVVRDVEFIRIRVLESQKGDADSPHDSKSKCLNNKEFLIPSGYGGKLQFIQLTNTRKTYKRISEVILYLFKKNYTLSIVSLKSVYYSVYVLLIYHASCIK